MTLVWNGYRDGLDPTFAADCDAAYGPLEATHVVTCGLRTNAEQAADFAHGRDASGAIVDPAAVITNARPGASPHNYGYAIDTAIQDGATLVWSEARPEWVPFWAATEAAPRLHSGHDFPASAHLDDWDHVERYHWRQHVPAMPP